MPRYFPSKKVFVVGVLAIVLLAWSVVHTKASQQISPTISENVLRSVANAGEAFPDDDRDGLSNWKEVLYQTNPNDSDSNNNGIQDGKEYLVEKKYAAINPVSLEEQYGLQRAEMVQNVDPENLSQTLLAKATVDYASLGGSASPEDKQGILNDLTSQFKEYNLENTYTFEDIKIVDGAQKNEESTYLVEFLFVISNDTEIYSIDVLQIIDTWDEREDSENIALLEKIQGSYFDISKKLSEIDVPQEMAAYHLALMNTLDQSAQTLEDVKVLSTDPVKSMSAAAAYAQKQSDRAKIMVGLTSLLGELLQE